MNSRSFLFIALAGTPSCMSFPASAPGVGGQPPYALSELGPADLARLGTQVYALRTEPAELRLRVGQRFSLGGLHVEAIDLRGRRLGRLRMYDRGVSGSGVTTLPEPGELAGEREGTDTLSVSYPASLWRGNELARPHSQIVVHVTK